MASTHIDYRKIDYDQLLDKPITRTSANVDTIKTAGVYDRGDGKRFLVSVDGNTITQIEESYNGYRTRTSTDGGLVRGTWTTAEFSDASAKRDVVVISGTEPVEKRETTAWIDTSDENKFKVYDGTDWMVISGQSIQTEEMPTASEELEGKIIQYEGATTSTFTHGYFYECVGDGQTPETYSWVNVPTQDSVEYTADEGIEIINGTRVDYSAMRGPCDAGFHVPTIEEMGAVFVDAGFTKEEVRNYLHVSLGVYSIEYNHTPASVSGGFYYCCNKNSSTRNVCYWTWNAMNPNIQGAKGTGRAYPIRAFKDVPSLPDATRTKTLTKGNIEVWDNPSIGLITVKINDTYYTLQDKNVGAVEVFSGTDFDLSEETGEDAKKQLGKLFQFGNNYGFYLTDLASHTTSNEKVDVSSYTPSTYQSSTFIITSTYTDNIYTGSYRDLWGGETGPQTITLHNAITNTGVLSINGKTGHVIIDTGSQAEVMPSPSAENVGTIIQYTGDTNQYYTHAHFYEVIEDPENPGTYIYKEVEVQDSPAQSEEMPEADEDNVGKIIQYMGDTTANFTHGYFYECVGDGQDPESFARERIDVQPAGAGDDHEVVTQAQYDALTPEQKAAKVYMIKGKGVAPTPGGGTAEDTSYDNTNSGLQADNVQDAIDEVVSDTHTDVQTIINKVNHLENTLGFFPLTEDNTIYTGSSFSYTAEEDTLLYISDNSDSYLKIDGRNISGYYSPGYVSVSEGQTITYNRECKVYKQNNVIIIDDSDVTLGLMDNSYLGPVEFENDQVAAVNSSYLGNNRVASYTGTGDATFHFDHTFNMQHSKMDKAELVLSGGLKYGDMGTVYPVATFNDSFEKVATIDIDIAKNGYFEQDGIKYTIKLNSFNYTDYSQTAAYNIDLLQLNNNFEVIDTINIVGTISSSNRLSFKSITGRYFIIQNMLTEYFTAYKINETLNGVELYNTNDVLFHSAATGRSIFDNFRCNDYIYYYGVGYYESYEGYPLYISRQDLNGNLTSILSTSQRYEKFGDCFIGIDYNNNDIYLILKVRYYGSEGTLEYFKIDGSTLARTSIDGTIFSNPNNLLGKQGFMTIEGEEAIIHTFLDGSVINDKNILKNNTIRIYSVPRNNAMTYTTENVLFPENILEVNGEEAIEYPILGYPSTNNVTKLQFDGPVSFTTTDTVSIDVTIKNNSGESRTVTLPKSGWSTSGNKTTGTGTTFTFNS